MTIQIAPRREQSRSEVERSAVQLEALQRSERRWAYVLLRLLLGVDLLGHGSIRMLHGVSGFASGMVVQMSSTPLSPAFVHAFGYVIPSVEFLLGALLIVGLLTRATLTVAMIFMIALMAGVTLKQDWPTAGFQLVYGFVVFSLLFLREQYDASWATLLRTSSHVGQSR